VFSTCNFHALISIINIVSYNIHRICYQFKTVDDDVVSVAARAVGGLRTVTVTSLVASDKLPASSFVCKMYSVLEVSPVTVGS
jgi:hypothetical protein